MKTDLQELMTKFEKEDIKVFRRLATEFSKPSRRKREVNLSRLNRYTKENEMIIVPGKVLGGGDINHKITISAFNFSESAIDKLQKAGSTIIPIEEINKSSVNGKKVRIIG